MLTFSLALKASANCGMTPIQEIDLPIGEAARPTRDEEAHHIVEKPESGVRLDVVGENDPVRGFADDPAERRLIGQRELPADVTAKHRRFVRQRMFEQRRGDALALAGRTVRLPEKEAVRSFRIDGVAGYLHHIEVESCDD